MDIPKKISKQQELILARLFSCDDYTIKIVDLCYDIANKFKIGLYDKTMDLEVLEQMYNDGKVKKIIYDIIKKGIKGYKGVVLKKTFTQSISRSISRLAKRGLVERIYQDIEGALVYVTPNFPITKNVFLGKKDFVNHNWINVITGKGTQYTYEEIRKKNICPVCIRRLDKKIKLGIPEWDNAQYCSMCEVSYKFVWGKKGTHIKLTPLGIEVCKMYSSAYER